MGVIIKNMNDENLGAQLTQLLSYNNKTIIVVFVVLVVIIAGGAGVLGAYFYTSSQTSLATRTPVPANPTPAPVIVHTIVGTVVSVKGDMLILKPENQTIANRTIFITSSTKITKTSIKNPKVFQTKMNAFIKAQKDGSKAIPPKPTVVTTTLKASDLSEGEHISVSSTKDINGVLSFTADKIQVYENPTLNIK